MADSVKGPTPWRDEERLRSLYCDKGHTVEEIADEFGVHSGTISDWLDRHDIQTDSNEARFRDEKPWRYESSLRELYHGEGLTTYEISDKWDVSAVTIQEWLDKHGISKRQGKRERHPNRPTNERLRELYPDKRCGELADEFDASVRAVLNWLHEADIEVKPRGGGEGEESHNWKEHTEGYYGPLWPKAREKAIQRDSEQCQRCGMGREEHRETIGKDLNVHHIQRVEDCESLEEAHKLSNLITLCIPCHRAVEQFPIDVRHLQDEME